MFAAFSETQLVTKWYVGLLQGTFIKVRNKILVNQKKACVQTLLKIPLVRLTLYVKYKIRLIAWIIL